MKRFSFVSVLLAISLLLASTLLLGPGGLVPAAAESGRLYELGPRSRLLLGCFPPCMCPVLIADNLRGTFRLKPAPEDPISPFNVFEVTDVSLTVAITGEEMPVTGSGTYEVGGEFAIMHRLELDLAVGDGQLRHFDSGLIVGGSQFPAIEITISIGGQVCFDTVIDVSAIPVPIDACV